MPSTTDLLGALREIAKAVLHWIAGWSRLVLFAALMLALWLSRSSYEHRTRTAIAHQLYIGAAPMLPWFTVPTAGGLA